MPVTAAKYLSGHTVPFLGVDDDDDVMGLSR